MNRARAISVDSATGVDVSLPVAGPGARSFAFLIDWHIRMVLCIAWYVVAAFLYNHGASITPPLSPGAPWFLSVIAPAATLYFLYHPLLEVAMGGLTPGKRMAGVRIVTLSGAVPGIGSLVARNVFRLVDSFPLAYAVGLAATLLTRHQVRVGDLAAGTLLVYMRADARLPLRPRPNAEAGLPPLAPARLEIAGELLQRWPEMEPHARRRLARELLEESNVTPAPAADEETALRAQLERLVG